MSKSQTYTILNHTRNGKHVDWRGKKIKSRKLAESFRRLGFKGRAARVADCASILEFAENQNTGEKRLLGVNYCRDRLCPMCQSIRSLQVFRVLNQVLNIGLEENPELIPLFLTVTMKNMKGEHLREGLDNLLKSWTRLFRRKRFKSTVKGWFRTVEITRSYTGEYHPHIHAVLLVPKEYFRRENSDYIPHEEWRELWKQALGVEYLPIVNIQKIKNQTRESKKGEVKEYTIREAVGELAKYVTKEADYLTDDEAETDERVRDIALAVYGKRLIAYGGLLKDIAKRVKARERIEKMGLPEDEKLRLDIGEMVVRYHWRVGLNNYVTSTRKLQE